MLPYTRWHDYCGTSYFVSEYAAKLNFTAILDRLALISEADANEKFAALRRVRDAFVFRRDSSLHQPTAPHFILSEACAAAKRLLNVSSTFGILPKHTPSTVARVDLRKCVLSIAGRD